MLVMQLAKNTARAIPGVADYVPPDPPSDEEILAAQKAAAEQVRGRKLRGRKLRVPIRELLRKGR